MKQKKTDANHGAGICTPTFALIKNHPVLSRFLSSSTVVDRYKTFQENAPGGRANISGQTGNGPVGFFSYSLLYGIHGPCSSMIDLLNITLW